MCKRQGAGVNRSDFYPVAMTIAGSDSGGGAGIQADLRTFAALGVYGCSAITALTAQNPFGVSGIQPADPENLKMQIQAVLAEFDVRAIKTGMLFSDGLIRVVAECLKGWNGMLIVDPVMISTSGVPLLKEEAVETLMAELLPRAAVVTPNRMEAERIAGMSIRSLQEMERAARICQEKFGCGVVVKGGHAEQEEESVDLCLFDGEVTLLRSPRLLLPECATHGTGCTFSAALAAAVASGMDRVSAAKTAKKFVFESLRHAVRPGRRVSAMFPPFFQKGLPE